jgi:CheY-like chemotaxis protein
VAACFLVAVVACALSGQGFWAAAFGVPAALSAWLAVHLHRGRWGVRERAMDTAPPRPTDKTLLVVEDNEVAREGLAVILRREGYAVALAADGQQGLDYLAANPAPDLILLDMLMPVLDDWRFLELLRPRADRVPVIVTTGTVFSREWAAEHGCAGFIKKPIDTESLLAEVRRCLGA